MASSVINSSSPAVTRTNAPQAGIKKTSITKTGLIQRLLLFGSITAIVSYYLYSKAVKFRKDSYNEHVWPLEYEIFYDAEDVSNLMVRCPMDAPLRLTLLLLAGSVNILFYSVFFMDLLTLCGGVFALLDWFPFVVGMVDFLENMILFVVLYTWPVTTSLNTLAGYVTATKTFLTYFLLGWILLGLLSAPCRDPQVQLESSTSRVATSANDKKQN